MSSTNAPKNVLGEAIKTLLRLCGMNAYELAEAGVAYSQDYCEGIYSTDFLIKNNGKRVAVECKANVLCDIEKSAMMAEILRKGLKCETVCTVVPFKEGYADIVEHKLTVPGFVVCEITGLLLQLTPEEPAGHT